MQIGYLGINFSLSGFIIAMIITVLIKKKSNSNRIIDSMIKILFLIATVSIVFFFLI